MSLKNEVLKWADACVAAEASDFTTAMTIFSEITDAGAKIHFNMGVIYATLERYEDAKISFTNAVFQDSYLAVGYFQKGAVQWILKDFHSALESFSTAADLMRNNESIDYTQLGLIYKLFMFEILFNRALCYITLGNYKAGIKDIILAQEFSSLDDHKEARYQPKVIQRHYGAGNILQEYSPFVVPEGLLFKPSARKVKNCGKMDFLGQSRVIASLDEEDTFIGFIGPQVRKAVIESSQKNSADSLDRRPSERSPELKTTHSDETSPYKRESPKINFDQTIKIDPRLPNEARRRPSERSGLTNIHELARNPSDRLIQSPLLTAKLSPTPSPKFTPDLELSSFTRHDDEPELSPRKIRPKSPERRPSESQQFRARKLAAQISNEAISPTYDPLPTPNPPRPRSDFSDLTNSGVQVSKFKIKCHLDEKDTCVIMLQYDQMNYGRLKRKILEKCGRDSIRLRYRDEDNEMVILNDQEDLEVALSDLEVAGKFAKLDLYVE